MSLVWWWRPVGEVWAVEELQSNQEVEVEVVDLLHLQVVEVEVEEKFQCLYLEEEVEVAVTLIHLVEVVVVVVSIDDFVLEVVEVGVENRHQEVAQGEVGQSLQEVVEVEEDLHCH